MKIYLIRHGEKAERTIEKEDPSLTAEGMRQIMLLARRLKLENVRADKIYSSSHIRSVETAQILSKKLIIPVIKDDRLVELERELFYGPDINVIIEEVIAVKNFVDELVSKNKDVILAFHGGINRLIIGHLLGIDFRQMRHFLMDFASLSLMQYIDVRGKMAWRVVFLNDTTHLRVP